MHFSSTFILFIIIVIVVFVRVQTTKIGRRDKKQLSDDIRNDQDSINEEPITTYNDEQDNQTLITWRTTKVMDDGSDKQLVDIPPHKRKNTLISNDESFTASLLLDIRDLLYRENEEKNQLFIPRTEQQRLEDLALQSQASIDYMSDNIERYREFTDERVTLVLETFSTLKLLVVNQGNQLNAAMEKLDRLEEKTSNLEMQVGGFQQSIYEMNSALKFSTNFDSIDVTEFEEEDDSINSLNDLNITQRNAAVPSVMSLNNKISTVARTVRSMQDELEGLRSNVTELIAVSQVITVLDKPSDPSSIITQGQRCQCPMEELRESIATLEEGQQTQNIYVDELARNLTHLQEMQRQEQPESSFSNRLGEVEGSLRDLNAVKSEMTEVKENLDSLKQELVRVDLSESATRIVKNATYSTVMKGLCVWPYTRCGDGCFYVNNNRRLNWMGARDHCRSIQGDLAAPTNYQDFKNFIGNQRLSRAYTYWIGASDIDIEGSWTWIDGRPIDQNSTLWASNEPSGSRSSNCMAFRPSNKFELLTMDEECRISKYFVCEQERYT